MNFKFMDNKIIRLYLLSLSFIIVFFISNYAIGNDVNNDTKVGLDDAIIALQVSSGIELPIYLPSNLNWAGNWNSQEKQYNLNDIVSYKGTSYICILPHISNSNRIPTNIILWEILALKGDTGDQGPKGDTGFPSDTIMVQNAKVGIGITPTANLTVQLKGDVHYTKRLTGEVTVGKNSNFVTGYNTSFSNELQAGDSILIADEIVSISKVVNDVSLIIDPPHVNGALSLPFFISEDIISVQGGNGKKCFVVTNSGNVGIGESNPKSKLDINGNINVKNGVIQFSDGSVLDSFIPTPSFDSGWFLMKSQAGQNSFTEITHNLGEYPRQVKVLIKAIDGANEGFIFEGIGMAQASDENEEYGGVVYAYNQNKVRLWAPDKNNKNPYGRIINVKDGWGGETNSQASDTAMVKVLLWK